MASIVAADDLLARMNSSRSSFTEAVPLSLSSMAHMTIPLSDGVLDGLKEVIQHTMLACINYARQTKAPGQWMFGDIHLSNDPLRGRLVKANKEKLPTPLQKIGFTLLHTFTHKYLPKTQTCTSLSLPT